MMSKDSGINYYLSYVLYYSYGEEAGEFGVSRFLSKSEQEKYKKIFSKIIENVDSSKLKYVDYCYYNCCEPDDFYGGDDFYKEI